jgi:large subunit ribosomal protein L29
MKTKAQLGNIRESSNDELKGRVKRLEEELFQHRLKRYTNQLENTNLIKSTRREIARAKSVLSARAVGLEQQVEKAETAETAEAKE